jgi:hypothetical protein
LDELIPFPPPDGVQAQAAESTRVPPGRLRPPQIGHGRLWKFEQRRWLCAACFLGSLAASTVVTVTGSAPLWPYLVLAFFSLVALCSPEGGQGG